MDIHSIRQALRTKSVYDIPLRVTFYARVSSESDVTKGAALKISRLPPDQQEEAAAVLKLKPPTPKRQGMIDSESALSEFKALCARYVSGIESLHHRADIFAGMTISQFDALGDSAYSVTTAIKEFFEKVHEIRHEMEKEHEN